MSNFIRAIIITNQISNDITNKNKNDNVTNLIPMVLTDGRICIGADIVGELSFSKYFNDIMNYPPAKASGFPPKQ